MALVGLDDAFVRGRYLDPAGPPVVRVPALLPLGGIAPIGIGDTPLSLLMDVAVQRALAPPSALYRLAVPENREIRDALCAALDAGHGESLLALPCTELLGGSTLDAPAVYGEIVAELTRANRAHACTPSRNTDHPIYYASAPSPTGRPRRTLA